MTLEISAPEAPARAASRAYTMPADHQVEALLASLKLAGVDRLWFTSGSELGALQEGSVKNHELGRPTPAIMTMTHESAALSAACGDTIVTGKPSATAFHVECGLINAGGAIHNTDRGRCPVLIMSGYPPSAEAGSVPGARSAYIQWYQQLRDQGELVRQYVRWDHKLAPYDNAGLVATRAAQVMLSEPKGPAYLALPREAMLAPIHEARFPTLDQLQPAGNPPPDRAELREVARLLLTAQNPLLCVGRPGRYTSTVDPLVELSELLGARVQTDNYRLSFPGSHPLFRGSCGISPTPADTDCLVSFDALVPWLPGKFDPGPDVRVVRISLDPIERMTTIYEFPTDLSIAGDAVKSISLLLDEVRTLMTPAQAHACAERRDRYEEEGRQRLARLVDVAEADRARGVIHPLWLSHQIGQTLDPETIVTHELAETTLFNRSLPGTQIGTGGSSLGWAAPAAVGAKVAAQDRQLVSVVGDGSWMFSNPQVTVWSSMFHKAPVLFIVCNNRGYRTGTVELINNFPEGYAAKTRDLTGGWFDPCPNYSGEAAASGAYGEKVTDPDEVGPAIRRGLDATRQGVPAVLDVWLPKLAGEGTVHRDYR